MGPLLDRNAKGDKMGVCENVLFAEQQGWDIQDVEKDQGKAGKSKGSSNDK